MKYLTLIALALFLTACSSYQPIIDTQYSNMANYEQDLEECQAYAGKVNPAGNAAAGAAIGVALGLVVSAIFGGSYRGELAGVGALHGATLAGASSAGNQQAIITNCLAGRGYRVLG